MKILLAIIAVLLVGCGSPTATDLFEASGLNCQPNHVRQDDADGGWVACWLDAHGPVAFGPVEQPAYFVAISMDEGEPGPWVIGDGWIVSTRSPVLADSLAEKLGGYVVTDWSQVED